MYIEYEGISFLYKEKKFTNRVLVQQMDSIFDGLGDTSQSSCNNI